MVVAEGDFGHAWLVDRNLILFCIFSVFHHFFHILWTVCRFISSFAFAVNWSEWCLSAAWVVLRHVWAAQWHKVSKKLFKSISFLWKILQQVFSYTVSAHMCTRFALLNYGTFYLFCLEPWFLCASHVIVSPAGAALRRRAVTTYYCPCSSKPSLTSKRAHRSEEHATLNSSHRRELGLQSVSSENAGGRQEAEAVRRDGVKCPCSRRQPTPEYLLYLRHTHSVLAAAVCRTHKNHVFSVCVCGCMQLWWLWLTGETWALSPPGTQKMTYLTQWENTWH